MAAKENLKNGKVSDQENDLESDSQEDKPNTDLKVMDKLTLMGKHHSMKLISSESVVVSKRRKVNSQTSSLSQDKDAEGIQHSNAVDEALIKISRKTLHPVVPQAQASPVKPVTLEDLQTINEKAIAKRLRE